MKKLALTGLLVISFIVYVIHERGEASEVAVGTPTTLTTSTVLSASPATTASAKYTDGQYDGTVADAFYGNVQVRVTVAGGKITDVVFLDYPQDRPTSREINAQAMPLLKQETIKTQTANVDIVSGATQTSRAFRESLQAALEKAG